MASLSDTERIMCSSHPINNGLDSFRAVFLSVADSDSFKQVASSLLTDEGMKRFFLLMNSCLTSPRASGQPSVCECPSDPFGVPEGRNLREATIASRSFHYSRRKCYTDTCFATRLPHQNTFWKVILQNAFRKKVSQPVSQLPGAQYPEDSTVAVPGAPPHHRPVPRRISRSLPSVPHTP